MKNYFEYEGFLVPFKSILCVCEMKERTHFTIGFYSGDDCNIVIKNEFAQPIIEDYKKWLEVNG